MPSNNSKYTPEYRQEICQLIVSTGRSATSVGEEMGIDKNKRIESLTKTAKETLI